MGLEVDCIATRGANLQDTGDKSVFLQPAETPVESKASDMTHGLLQLFLRWPSQPLPCLARCLPRD